MLLIDGSVTSPKGFLAAGIHCGIKKSRKDLALIYSPTPCSAAGTFTLNKVKAAPLQISQAAIHTGQSIHAVLVNSGNANACTGTPGLEDALDCRQWMAAELGVDPTSVLISSTGVIGQRLPMDKLQSGIGIIAHRLTNEGGWDAACAIMTTDTHAKSLAVKIATAKGEITIGAIAKGSGMIMPNMATMLCFLTTDASVDRRLLQSMLLEAVDRSFHRITVDGDTSTNDMVVALANGLSGISIEEGSEDRAQFQMALTVLCAELAKQIVTDGEGATKLITVIVEGAHTQEDAVQVGKRIANSPLVKTAIHGQDANWGRILSAAGSSGVPIDPERITIFFDNEPVLLQGYTIVLDEEKATAVLGKKEVTIKVHLGAGQHASRWWTCDLSADYVRINASYRT
jgi:glutamate N-acetyltransferase/amino-acid N-acetyltransferase